MYLQLETSIPFEIKLFKLAYKLRETCTQDLQEDGMVWEKISFSIPFPNSQYDQNLLTPGTTIMILEDQKYLNPFSYCTNFF